MFRHLICALLNHTLNCNTKSVAVNLEAYLLVSSKLKLGIAGDDFSAKLNSSILKSQQTAVETDNTGSMKTGEKSVRNSRRFMKVFFCRAQYTSQTLALIYNTSNRTLFLIMYIYTTYSCFGCTFEGWPDIFLVVFIR